MIVGLGPALFSQPLDLVVVALFAFLVLGSTLIPAQDQGAILAGHCRVGHIGRTHSKADVGRGRVVSQSPRAQTRLKAGGQVDLIVSGAHR
jgi:beta-lactam-binding protein with PASTA domain